MFIQWAAFKLKRLSPSTMSSLPSPPLPTPPPPYELTHEVASVAYETGRARVVRTTTEPRKGIRSIANREPRSFQIRSPPEVTPFCRRASSALRFYYVHVGKYYAAYFVLFLWRSRTTSSWTRLLSRSRQGMKYERDG